MIYEYLEKKGKYSPKVEKNPVQNGYFTGHVETPHGLRPTKSGPWKDQFSVRASWGVYAQGLTTIDGIQCQELHKFILYIFITVGTPNKGQLISRENWSNKVNVGIPLFVIFTK